jgi:hypothetical protein
VVCNGIHVTFAPISIKHENEGATRVELNGIKTSLFVKYEYSIFLSLINK